MKDKVTIVIPVKEEEETVSKFIEGNKKLLESNRIIVVDSGGGEQLKGYCFIYIRDISHKYTMSEARRIGINLVNTPLTFNLDVDVILPTDYLGIINTMFSLDNNIGAISTDYTRLQGHLAFGNSVWRTELLKELYDYNNKEKRYCECLYLWGKLNKTKYKLETIGCNSLRCKHLKENKIK